MKCKTNKMLYLQILNDDVQADFYIATPEILPKLNLLKNKLRKKFPKNKRGMEMNQLVASMSIVKSMTIYSLTW